MSNNLNFADVIYADPPWAWNKRTNRDTKFGGGAGGHYELLTAKDLCSMPVSSLAAKRSVCFMWAVLSKLEEALAVMSAWGFQFVTVHSAWIKTSKSGVFKGPGYYSMNNAELVLLGRRGNPYVPWERYPTSLLAPLQEHSKKPDEMASRIDGMYPDLYKVELFARTQRQHPLWAVWGNEVASDEDVEAVFAEWSSVTNKK